MKTNRILVSGNVQGVGFRYLTKELAEKHQIKGWVRNLMTGSVEMMVTGEEEKLQQFVQAILNGNRFYFVEGIDIQNVEYKRFSQFEIIANG